MATMNVTLPETMQDWVEARTRAGRYDDTSDYVRDLIRRDQEREAKRAEFQALVTQGLESGTSSRSEDEIRRLSKELAASRAP